MAFLLETDEDHDVFVAINIVSGRKIRGESSVVLNHNGLYNLMTHHYVDAEITSFQI
jgi:hypothetical protein